MTSLPHAGAKPSEPTLPLADIQGLILRGYSYYYARHFIFRINDGPGLPGVRAFLRAVLPRDGAKLCVTTAAPWKNPPAACLNLGLTSSGLRQLLGDDRYAQVNDNTTSDLFDPFHAGAAARARFVGDTGDSAPAKWWHNGNWKLPGEPTTHGLDLVASLYTRDPADRAAYTRTLLGLIPAGSGGRPVLLQAFVQDSDPVLDGQGRPTHEIHFGYEDGISQPRIGGTPWDDPGDPTDDSPMVKSWFFAMNNDSALYYIDDLLTNGCFAAFRLLHQDVPAFEAFLAQTRDPGLTAAKMCGRWLDGTPLEVSPHAPDPSLRGFDLTNFDYLAPTPHQKGPRLPDAPGAQCPYAAHTRRTNPRDDDNVQGNDNPGYPYAQQHRVRRFATPYGPQLVPGKNDDAQRGLVGWFMGANLTDQFEFVMQTWITNGGFRSPDASPNESGVDPLFGPHADDPVANHFEFDYLPAAGSPYSVVPNLKRFIRTDGGLYAFLPGIRALRTMAAPANARPRAGTRRSA